MVFSDFFLVRVVFGSGGYFGSGGFWAGLRFWFWWFRFGSGGLDFGSDGLKPQRQQNPNQLTIFVHVFY